VRCGHDQLGSPRLVPVGGLGARMWMFPGRSLVVLENTVLVLFQAPASRDVILLIHHARPHSPLAVTAFWFHGKSLQLGKEMRW
jgi:hypothetical protein